MKCSPLRQKCHHGALGKNLQEIKPVEVAVEAVLAEEALGLTKVRLITTIKVVEAEAAAITTKEGVISTTEVKEEEQLEEDIIRAATARVDIITRATTVVVGDKTTIEEVAIDGTREGTTYLAGYRMLPGMILEARVAEVEATGVDTEEVEAITEDVTDNALKYAIVNKLRGFKLRCFYLVNKSAVVIILIQRRIMSNVDDLYKYFDLIWFIIKCL